jgi:hypothetical protein
MNQVKLTLSIPKKLLWEAKLYSRKTHQPLSRLVSRYFSILIRDPAEPGGREAVSSRVKQVTGLAKSDRHEKGLLFDSLRRKYL